MPGFTVDGTDLMKVYESMGKAVERARKGDGPTLIECVVYRLRGHSAGDVGPYRPKKEEEEWNKKYDPIKKYKEELLKQKLLGNQEIEKIEEEIEKEIEEAVRFAQDSKAPLSETVSKYVYREEENNE